MGNKEGEKTTGLFVVDWLLFCCLVSEIHANNYTPEKKKKTPVLISASKNHIIHATKQLSKSSCPDLK